MVNREGRLVNVNPIIDRDITNAYNYDHRPEALRELSP